MVEQIYSLHMKKEGAKNLKKGESPNISFMGTPPMT
jgi:hypothetical protein